MIRNKVFTLLASLLMVACADDFYELTVADASDTAGSIGFAVSTTEMRRQRQDAATRAALNGDTIATEDLFRGLPLEGDNPHDLHLYSLSMPAVGIHRGAVSAADAEGQVTRAANGTVVKTDASNFHDSLTIWGYTDGGRTLFRQILLQKIQHWRSSVQWPYAADGSSPMMTFYALSPSIETLDVTVNDNASNFNNAPKFTYSLPARPAEMVDLLYGTSSPRNIFVQEGPTGSTDGDPKMENIGMDNKIVDLVFSHILTAVRFSKTTLPANIRITDITLYGICKTGTFDPDVVDPTTGTAGTWSNQKNEGAITMTTNYDNTTEGDYIDSRVMFMIPHTLGSLASLSVTLEETIAGEPATTKRHTLTCPLRGEQWKKGYTVNYQITVGQVERNYVLTVETPEALEHSTSPTQGNFSVHSYHRYIDYSTTPESDVNKPVSWMAVGYSTTEPDENTVYDTSRPSWLGAIGVGTLNTPYDGGSVATGVFSVNGQEYTSKINHNEILEVNSQTPVTVRRDLSQYDPNGVSYGKTITANCYIVNRVGAYQFPLVYGNKTNDSVEPACFKDHAGHPIHYANISDQLGYINSTFLGDVQPDPSDNLKGTRDEYVFDAVKGGVKAVILWQDYSGLLGSALSVVGNTIQFSVATPVVGNAVIALQGRKMTVHYMRSTTESAWVKSESDNPSIIGEGDNWETLWTWHIWMTDEVFDNDDGTYNVNDKKYTNWDDTNKNHLVEIENASNVKKTILPVSLGWVPDEDDFYKYSKREVWVKLKQAEPGSDAQTCVVKITQHARPHLVSGTGTVYQWGRPTAFPSIRKSSDAKTTRLIVDGENEDITSSFVLAVVPNDSETGDAISQPYKVLQLDGNANTWFPLNTYSNAMWGASKTVYDPCPPGFQVPSANIFTGLSLTGIKVQKGDQLNVFPDKAGQKSAVAGVGGYFFVSSHNTTSNTISEANRYDAVYYMPATGEYNGNKNAGQLLSEQMLFFDNDYCLYWTNDYEKNETTKAPALWLTPDWARENEATKPAYEIGQFNYYSSLRQVRPQKKSE